MGKYIDFAVRYHEKEDTKQQVVERILYSLIVKRLKGKKPCVIFLGGDSGEGKSYGALKLYETILESQGLDPKDYVEACNVFTPVEYPKKMDALLHDKALKKVNVLIIHEARDVVKAKMWHSFLNQAIADVNAMSRAIKPIVFIVVSQFIRDISSDIRYTITYYGTMSRPLGKSSRLRLETLWKDDRDLQTPKLRKRRIRGYLQDQDLRKRLIQPDYITLTKPMKEIREQFDKLDYEAKALRIRQKMDKLIKEMSIEYEDGMSKINAMVNWYTENQENLNMIGKRVRGKFKLKEEVKDMHDMTAADIKLFEKTLNDKMIDKGMMEVEG